jgi:N-acetylglucosamine-6-phosphate deacetylase
MKITARSLSGEVLRVQIEGPVFGKISRRKEQILDLPWIAPGLVDIQINGFGGIDFNRSLASDEAWEQATEALYAHGCTGFLATLITNRADGYRELLGGLVPRLRRDPRNCLGFHFEGPWLNPDPDFRGAHRAEWMQKPDLALLEEWHATVGDGLKLITLAPEIDLEGSRRVMDAGRKLGVRFFIGHSGAMGETLDAALAAGAAGWTHLGNAAPAVAPKFENVILHALARPDLPASLIPDGIHLPPHAFRVLARTLALGENPRLLLTTDAMAAAGAGRAGRYTLGEIDVEVKEGGEARLPGTGRLAGSTLTPFAGVFQAERMAGLFLEQAWAAFSTRPAALLGLRRELAEGHVADFCLLSPEKSPRLLATYARGKCVFEAD